MHEPHTWSAHFCAHIQKRGMSQADVARALDAHPSAVHYWCRGAKPRDPAMLVRIQRWSRGDVNADAPAQVAAESPDTEKAAVG